MRNRILMVADEARGLAMELPSMDLRASTDTRGALAYLGTQHFDAVMVVLGGSGRASRGFLEDLHTAADREAIPVVLAFDAVSAPLVCQVDDGLYDAVLDLRWDEAFKACCVEGVIQRVRASRNLVAIQREILMEVQASMTSLRELAFNDELTGLFNVRSFRSVVEKEHARCVRNSRSYGIIYVDVDNLKQINARYGHAVGSMVLAEVGRCLTQGTRRCDFAFRVGGDEFVILVVEADAAATRRHADLLTQRVQRIRVEHRGEVISATVSAGVASYPADGVEYEQVLANADRALSRCKNMGKNCVAQHQQALTS